MKIIAIILALTATVTAQNFIQVPPTGSDLSFAVQPEYAPVQPLTQFNAATDGFYGYNPYSNAIGLPQQAPLTLPPYNNFAPAPYQFPAAYPHPAYPNPGYPNPAYPNPGYPNPAYPQFPVFSQFPQLFPQQLPQLPNPFQPAIHPAYPQQVIQYGAPQSNAAALPYANYQTPMSTPTHQPMRPATAPSQGVNGLPKPVTTSNLNSSYNITQVYGPDFGKYVSEPLAITPQPARYEAVSSGSTVHTTVQPGHAINHKVVSEQPVAAAAAATAASVPGTQ